MQILGATFEFCAKFQIKTNSDWSKHSFPVFTLAHTKSKQIKRRQIWFGHLIFASSQNILKNLIFSDFFAEHVVIEYWLCPNPPLLSQYRPK